MLKTIESAKDQFTADELKLLKAEAEKIREIENELTKLEEKFPEIAKKRLLRAPQAFLRRGTSVQKIPVLCRKRLRRK